MSNGTFGALTSRYSNKAGKIEFDDFFMCVVKMTTMFGMYSFTFSSVVVGSNPLNDNLWEGCLYSVLIVF